MRPLLLLLLPAILLNRSLPAGAADERLFEHVEVVIGDVLISEDGGWSPDNSPLKRPFGIDFTADGRMFIVELEGGRIHRRDPTGDLLWVSGDGSRSWKGDGGPLGDATFNGMHNCAITPRGDVYIADTWNHCIRRIDADTGNISRFAGTGESGFSGDGGPAMDAQFSDVMCVTLTPDADVLHVVDIGNRRIRAIDLATGLTTTIAGNGSRGVPEDGAVATQAPLVDPRAAAADTNGNLYILERGGHALRVVRPNRTIHTVAGNGEKGFLDGRGPQAQFHSPKHLCVAPDNRVYIADDRNAAIRQFDPDSQQVTTILGQGTGEKTLILKNPHGVCWEGKHLYIVDTSHNRILRMVPPERTVDSAAGDRP